jgi:hypothetical protein
MQNKVTSTHLQVSCMRYANKCLQSFTHDTSQTFTGQVPFQELKIDSAVIFAVLEGQLPQRLPSERSNGLTNTIWELMARCWNKDPSSRPSAEAAVGWIKREVGESLPETTWDAYPSSYSIRTALRPSHFCPSKGEIEADLSKWRP